jgi:ABC-2 type transport system permease protein
MGKYLMTISNALKNTMIYRANSAITVFSVFLSLVILFYFWNSVYRSGGQIGNYSLLQIISYYFFVAVFELLFQDNTAWNIGGEIKNGEITGTVLRPIKYLEFKFSQAVGYLCYRIIFYVPVILLSAYLLRSYLIFPENISVWIFFVALSLAAFFLYFLIFYMVGLCAFWFSDSMGFAFSAWVIIDFLQGGLLPLDLMPKWILNVSAFLPFKYMFYVPAGVVSGRINIDYWLMIIPFAWALFLYFMAIFVYNKGLKRYEGYGI